MSIKTAADHTPLELTHEGTADGVATFSSASKSTGGRNLTYVDVATLETTCRCQGAQSGKVCWHVDHAPVAFAMTRVAAFLATLDDATLEAVGRAAAALIEQRGQTITDLAVYYAAKVSYCQRARARREAAALLAALPATLPTRRLLPCPDCGEPARREVGLCDGCMADLLAQRAGMAA